MVRIGVVGVGGMGNAHCNALPNVENCEFVGVADLRLDAAEAVAERHQIRAFQDYQELFDLVDGVVVATPPVAHTQVIVDAAASRRARLLRKTALLNACRRRYNDCGIG